MYIIVYKKQIIKMDKTKLIESIKSQLKSLITSEVKFAQVKAGDMMISSSDEELVVGSEVFTIDPDGNNIPLADGEYTLDSGEKITVANGKVEGIVNAEAPETEVEAEVEVEINPEGETETDEAKNPEETKKEDGKEEKVAALEARIAKCEKMLEEMSANNNKMAQELSKVSGEPSTKSISIEPTEFKSVEEKKEGIGAVDIMAIREKARAGRK
jgi:uncharacterized protein YcfL